VVGTATGITRDVVEVETVRTEIAAVSETRADVGLVHQRAMIEDHIKVINPFSG
jgi:hypothetical protein